MAGRSPQMHLMPVGGGAWSDVAGPFAPAGFLHPVPSPDRAKIAIGMSTRQGGFGGDWRIDIDVRRLGGGADRLLTPEFPRPFYSASHPSWASDSRHLAFELSLCPYPGCDRVIRSVVLVDTEAKASKLAFVGYGGGAEIARAAPP